MADTSTCRLRSRNADSNSKRTGIVNLFIVLCIYRLANAWMIRTQFDPDEYWQTLEPAYCLAFASTADYAVDVAIANDVKIGNDERIRGCALTWEWTRRWTPSTDSPTTTEQSTKTLPFVASIGGQIRLLVERAFHGPVRSYVSVLPTYWYYLACRAMFRWADANEADANSNNKDTNSGPAYCTNNFRRHLKELIRQNATYIISKGPAFLHAILIAAPTDLSVWLIANQMQSTSITYGVQPFQWFQSWSFWALTCSLTSWFHGYALIRTYANSVETVCLLVGIALMRQELFGQAHSGHRPQAKLAFVLGGLSACVRFTSLAAWIPVGLIVSFRMGWDALTQKYSYHAMVHTLIRLCAIYGFIGVVLGCCVDCWFYGFWTMPFLGNIHFNVLLGHGSLYGTHPSLWYIYAGIPAITGMMLPFFVWEAATVMKDYLSREQPPISNSITNGDNNPRAVILAIIVPYVGLHSVSEHKEFRFLLPLLPLICVLAAHRIYTMGEASRGRLKSSSNETKKITAMGKGRPVLLAAFILLNYPHLLYLGVIHQRGPVAVNQYLASTIEGMSLNKQIGLHHEYSIHYLMGCHSAPLYSHLHVPNARINAWYLDCSPKCRSSNEIVCESDAFSTDKFGFTKSIYDKSENDSSCSEHGIEKDPPSFLVVMQDDVTEIESWLRENLNMSHLASIRHTVKSLSWHNRSEVEYASQEGRRHNAVTLFHLVDIHFDHMEVFSRVVS